MKKTLWILLCFVCALGIGFHTNGANGKAYTSSRQIKKELKSLGKQIAKSKKEVAKAKKEYTRYRNKQKNSATGIPVFCGQIVNSDPCVVRANGTYYYISNPGAGAIWLGTFTSNIQKTGGTRYINGYTAVCARAISDPYEKESIAAKKTYQKKAKQLIKYQNKQKKLKKALTFRVSGKDCRLYLGWKDTATSLAPAEKYYNKITWKSSNPSIASVTSQGFVKGKKVGDVVITAKTNISKKTKKFKVYVRNRPTLDLDIEDTVIEKGDTKTIKICDDKLPSNCETNWYSSDESICSITYYGDRKGKIKGKKEGTAWITVTRGQYLSRFMVTIIPTYYPTASFNSKEIGYTNADIGTQKTIGFTSNISDIQVVSSKPDLIRIDSVTFPQIGRQSQCVEGTVTYTILDNEARYDNNSVKLSFSSQTYNEYSRVGDVKECAVRYYHFYGSWLEEKDIRSLEFVLDGYGQSSEDSLVKTICLPKTDYDSVTSVTVEGDCCKAEKDDDGYHLECTAVKPGTAIVKVTYANGIQLTLPVVVKEIAVFDATNHVRLDPENDIFVQYGDAAKKYYVSNDEISRIYYDSDLFEVHYGEGYANNEFEIAAKTNGNTDWITIYTKSGKEYGFRVTSDND